MSSAGKFARLSIRVHCLTGITSDALKRFNKNVVSISAEYLGITVESARTRIGGIVKVNDATWSSQQGTLRWDVPIIDNSQTIKSLQPTIKLQISFVNELLTGSNSHVNYGYVLIDVKDLLNGKLKGPQKFKVYGGMNGAELEVSGNISNTASTISSAGRTSSHNLMASTESMQSVLHIESIRNSLSDFKAPHRFELGLNFLGYKNISSLCQRCIENEIILTGTTMSSMNRKFWLCWTIFNKTFKSDEFSSNILGQKVDSGNDYDEFPRKVRDNIRVECSSPSGLLSALATASPLKVFLCTERRILGKAEIDLVDAFASKDSSQPLPWIHPKTSYDMVYIPNESEVELRQAPIPATLDVSFDIFQLEESSSSEEYVENKVKEIKEPAMQSPEVNHQIHDSPDSEYSMDEFENDEENEKAVQGKEVRFQLFDDNHELSSPVSVVNKGTDPADSTSSVQRPTSTGSNHNSSLKTVQNDGKYDADDSEEFDDQDYHTRHFRISIDVRSIGGLKRPAYIGVQFCYPHLGSGTSSPVRTHPQWALANADNRIDGAAVSYDCCITRARLHDILSSHPLKINAVSRSQMGYNILGDVVFHIEPTSIPPHSYRCPLTLRTFAKLKDYTSYRQVMMALQSAGKVEHVPPRYPVEIRVYDSFHCINASTSTNENSNQPSTVDGAKMRVIVIVEDLGIVGSEIATSSVKPGYSMHNGALFQVNSNGESLSSATTAPTDDPLLDSQAALTPTERAHLEALKLDWENWRRSAELHWRDSLAQKENTLKTQLELEASAALVDRTQDLKRAQEEVAKLEIRLRGSLDAVERQKAQLSLKEEQMNMRLAQKTAELQLLQKRVRDESKLRIDAEIQKSEGLESQVSSLKKSLERAEKRAIDAERDFDNFRQQSRSTPESILREEVARLKAQLGEVRSEVERERRMKAETELEKEHFRAQMNRLALALKREREKNNVIARQDLENLRLEFLAREERFTLDGDREELHNIRHQLAGLKNSLFTMNQSAQYHQRGASSSSPLGVDEHSYLQDDL